MRRARVGVGGGGRRRHVRRCAWVGFMGVSKESRAGKISQHLDVIWVPRLLVWGDSLGTVKLKTGSSGLVGFSKTYIWGT